MERKLKDSFLALVRLGIGHPITNMPSAPDWPAIQALAFQQGLSAIVVDGLEKAPEALRPSKNELLQLIGSVLQGYEYQYELYRRTIAEMAGFYNSYGLKMMVLKGFACSLTWPKPEHRPTGDIDIWQFGEYKKADALVSSEKGIKVDTTHHHHTVFRWRDFSVENHYDFINVHHHKSNAEIESILKDLGKDDSHFVNVCGEKVYLPSPNLHALFLLKHTMMHFAAGEITLRQLLDWAFHVQAKSSEIDWPWLISVLDDFGMIPAFTIFNAICVADLGFDVSLFPKIQYDVALKERVLNEILSPEFVGEMPKNLIKRIFYKIRRWRANAWKHRLCYKESLWSAFWSGIWNHLIKPGSI